MIARPAHVSVLLVGHWQSAMQKSWPPFLSRHSPTGNCATYSKKVSESHGAWKPRTGMRLEGDRGRKTMPGALAPEVGREGGGLRGDVLLFVPLFWDSHLRRETGPSDRFRFHLR